MEEAVIVDGIFRPYAVYLPSRPCLQPKRAVFYLHGADEYYPYAAKLYAEADRRNYLLVGLQGMKNVDFYYANYWGRHEPVTGWALSTDLDHPEHPDLRYFDAVLKEVQSRFAIDDNHVHLAGFSNGAFFINMLAGYRSRIIASVAVSSGGMEAEGINKCGEDENGYCFVRAINRTAPWLEQMERKYPVFMFAGDHDPLVPPEYTREARDAYVTAGWSETGEAGAPEVRLKIVSGLLFHDWPRGWNNFEGYDATPEVFDFFDSHPRTW